MHDEIQNQILRLQAHGYVQTADFAALQTVVRMMQATVSHDALVALDTDAIFLTARKKQLHMLLESLEKTQPALAARIQEVIDDSCKNVPFTYD